MSDKPSTTERPQDRLVRVFVSSTFRDMHAEREELVKRVFPELRRHCRERAIEFVDVDLRWGINDEQKAEGKVLPICLAEIERCRPYFIGLLGERYGWVPREIDEALTKEQGWLLEHREKSVTELEMIHGVLQNPEMRRLAYFYFRSPEASAQVERLLSSDPSYEPEPDAARQKLSALKDRIYSSGYPVHYFPDSDSPDATAVLGRLVLEDLWKAIDERYPIEKVPTPLERQRMEHDAFAEARTKVYVGRREYLKRLDDHVTGNSPPLVLLGESGSGKSALIANWAKEYRSKHPGEFMVVHFIGGTAYSADYVAILRRIMEEIRERYESPSEQLSPSLLAGEGQGEGEIPTDPRKLIEAFPLWLAKAAARGRFILVLDALNQLEDRDNAPDLGWLPAYFPPDVRVILSTLEGRSLTAINKRGWETYHVDLLTSDERRILIPSYLRRFTKELSRQFIERIATAGQTANPLYLKALLEELRVYGDHATLGKRIEHYLEAETVDDLYERILARLEEDYEQDRPGLVGEATSLIWASRRGLTEPELLGLLGSDSNPLPRASWSPLFLALEDSLVNRSGLLNFFHDYLRKGVQDRYLSGDQAQKAAHLRLAGYFEHQEIDDRKVDELPWQLAGTEAWDRLKDCVAEPGMFLRLFTEQKQFELTGYWLGIGQRFDMVETYYAAIARMEQTGTSDQHLSLVLNEVARFLNLNARHKGAEPLYRRALAIDEASYGPDHPNVARDLNNLARLLSDTNHHAEAEPLYRRALAINEASYGPDNPNMAIGLNNLALLLSATNRHTEAEPLYRRALAIWETSYGPDHPYVATGLNNLAMLLKTINRHAEAEPLYRRALSIDEASYGPDHPNVAIRLNNLAGLLSDTNRHTEAEPLMRRMVSIFLGFTRSTGHMHPHLQSAVNNYAALLQAMGRSEEQIRAALREMAPEYFP